MRWSCISVFVANIGKKIGKIFNFVSIFSFLNFIYQNVPIKCHFLLAMCCIGDRFRHVATLRFHGGDVENKVRISHASAIWRTSGLLGLRGTSNNQ
jgi:hypothetical protein